MIKPKSITTIALLFCSISVYGGENKGDKCSYIEDWDQHPVGQWFKFSQGRGKNGKKAVPAEGKEVVAIVLGNGGNPYVFASVIGCSWTSSSQVNLNRNLDRLYWSKLPVDKDELLQFSLNQ